MTLGRTLLTIGLVITLGRGAGGAQDQPKLSEKQATEIGTDVYVYGYPLITLEITRRLTTNIAEPAGLRAPMGQFFHRRTFPPITYRDIPGANVDTLYSAAWLDLGKEPYILTVAEREPDAGTAMIRSADAVLGAGRPARLNPWRPKGDGVFVHRL